MRRKFGRRRRGSSEARVEFDVERELARVVASRLVPAQSLEAVPASEISRRFAAVGVGESLEARRVVVGVAPQAGGDAWLAALAVAARLAEAGEGSEVWAVSANWSVAARRRLALTAPETFRVQAVQEPGASGVGAEVAPEPPELPILASESQLVAQLSGSAERELFERSSSILRGLAHKHGGQLRLHAGGIDLVLLAHTVATLRIEPQGVVLEGVVPHRTRIELGRNGVAEAFDRVEGLIRKRLNDKKVRDSEESFRSRLLGILARLSNARSTLRWPLGGQEPDPVDFLAVDANGQPVIGAIRRELDLEQLGSILDALGVLQPRLPALLAGASAPVRWERPRLVLAAQRIDAAVERALRALAIRNELFDVETRRGEPVLVAREVGAPLRTARMPSAVVTEAARMPSAVVTEASDAAEVPRPVRPGARRGPREHRFEEVSVFELEEEGAAAEVAREGRRRRRRRGRGRGRGRESAPGEEPAAGALEEAQADEAFTARARPGNGSEEDGAAEPDETDAAEPRGETDTAAARELLLAEDVDDEGSLSPLSPDVLEAVEEPEPAYDDEEEADDESDPELDRVHLEREARRRARLAEVEPEPEPVRRPPRRRAALVALADRDALGATILLARDLRLVEGIWVYPQDELMTFFRGVATDLNEATPIYLVGFTASPARDTLQAASLYRDRLFWFDHHTWPPEDLEGLRAGFQVWGESHQAQRRSHSAKRRNSVRVPTCGPSPCAEEKISTRFTVPARATPRGWIAPSRSPR
jgi:hypothetical protein